MLLQRTYMWALYAREVMRFRKLWIDTVFNPIVSVGLYLVVFGMVLGHRMIGDVNNLAFVYAGLLAMTMLQSSFSNPSFALIIAKNTGNIVDLQLVPIRPVAIGVAYAMAALTRGCMTFLLGLVCTAWFVPGWHMQHPFLLMFALVITGLEFGMLGLCFGMWARSFESMTFVTTFVMQPLIFLAGVFYPIASLPGIWSTVSLFNPIHHNVNLFRYSMLGYQDVSPWISFGVSIGITVLLTVVMAYVTEKSLRQR